MQKVYYIEIGQIGFNKGLDSLAFSGLAFSIFISLVKLTDLKVKKSIKKCSLIGIHQEHFLLQNSSKNQYFDQVLVRKNSIKNSEKNTQKVVNSSKNQQTFKNEKPEFS